MAAPTSSNEVTVGQLSKVLVGSDGNGGMWKKVKDYSAAKAEGVYYVVGTHDYPAWVANHAYAVNDTVNYSNQIKVCKTAHTSGSSYDSSKWNNLGTPVLKGTISGITALYEGLKIAYKWPCTGGTSSTYLNINGLGNVYIRRNDSNITTHLPVNTVTFLAYDGTYWRWADYDYAPNNWVTTMGAYCDTAAATAAKVAISTNTSYTAGETFLIKFTVANTSAGKLTLNINSQGAKDIWINGAVSSSSNYTIPAGEHWCHYDGSVFHIWTDGTAQFTKVKAGTFTGNLTGNVTGNVTGNCSGSSGSCTGNAATATSAGKLTTARKTYVTLGTASTTTTRDWSGDTTIPVNGTLAVGNGGTGLTTATNVNSVVIGNSSSATGALQTVATASGAFYATGANAKPAFGTLPVAQGGTGQTSLANVTVGKASKINTSAKIGDTNKPVYVAADGTVTAISYTIATSVPSGAVFTDAKVTQTNTDTSTSGQFRLLMSGTADDTTRTEGARKSTYAWFSPSSQTLGSQKFSVAGGCTLQYNSTTQSLDFVF